MKDITVKFELSVNEIYRYMLYHTFVGTLGIFRIGISLLFLGVATITAKDVHWIYTFLLICIGCMNPIISPIILYKKSKRVAEEKQVKEYHLKNHGLIIWQKGQSKAIPWSAFTRIIMTKRLFILYTNINQALIIPRYIMEADEKIIVHRLNKLGEGRFVQNKYL